MSTQTSYAEVLQSLSPQEYDALIQEAWEEAQRLIDAAAVAARPPRFKFRGSNAKFVALLEPPRPAEIILEGAAQGGKTIAALQLVDALARKYPNARGAILRQYHVDLAATVLDIFKREFVEPAGDIHAFGGESPLFYDYPNGTRLWAAGMDRPGKVLSGGLDFIYFNQAEETNAAAWETLSTRTTGRAGVIVPGILFGDMNPAGLSHWIYAREAAGHLKILLTTHKDNPTLYDDGGQLTALGKVTLERLSNLTGVRRSRLFEGKRVSAEGLVYDEVYDDTDGESVTAAAEYVAQGGSLFWAADDGYSAGSAPQSRGKDPQSGYYVADAHPRVFLLCQLKSDGHLDVFAESSACGKLTDEHIAEVLQLPYPRPEFVSYGPGAAEFRGRLFAAQLVPHQQTEKVETSIQELRSWLAKDANGFRRIRIHPRCKQLRAEFLSYVYDVATQKPVKAYDHHLDSIRGLVWVLKGLRR